MIPTKLNIVTTLNHAPDLVQLLTIGADYHLSQNEKAAAIQVLDQVLASQVEPTLLDVVKGLQTRPDLKPFARAVKRCFLPS